MDLNFKKNNIDKDHPDFVYDKAYNITLIHLQNLENHMEVGGEVALYYHQAGDIFMITSVCYAAKN